MIKKILTLGPRGTNCEAAANYYINRYKLDAEVVLKPTLEIAAEAVLKEKNSALLACIVYPGLHELCFPYLGILAFHDVFLFDTYNMLLASKKDVSEIKTVATHPAPKALVPSDKEVILATSNSAAAQMCLSGEVDACITTYKSLESSHLNIIKNFGKIKMGFTIHVTV